jgi:hypothetical protein
MSFVFLQCWLVWRWDGGTSRTQYKAHPIGTEDVSGDVCFEFYVMFDYLDCQGLVVKCFEV